MTRFAGLIVAAIVMIAGGLGAVAFGAFMIFEFIHQPSLSSGVSTVAVNALLNFMMVVMLLVPTAGGVWSILTGGGLLRQLKWARTSALVIAAITLTISVPVFLLMLVVPIVSMRKSGGIDALVMLRAATIAALPVAISVWALWYLNNAEVKKQFGIVRTGAFAPIPLPATRKISARPTAVSLIAWYLIVSGGLLVSSVPMYLLLRSPWIFFGFILHAWSAIGVSLVWAGASVAAGIALLKAKESGRRLAIGVFSISLLNIFITLLRPGFQNVMRQFLDEMYKSLGMSQYPQLIPIAPMVWFGFLLGLPIPIMSIVYLVKQRELGQAKVEA